jgi:hypothetical protein
MDTALHGLDLSRWATGRWSVSPSPAAPSRVDLFKIPKIDHEIDFDNLTQDDSSVGYWVMRMQSLNGITIVKAVEALKLIVGKGSMNCAYIDTPHVVVRFDMKKRTFDGLSLRNDHPSKFMLKSKLAMTDAEDPDAVILPDEYYTKESMTKEDIVASLAQLKKMLLVGFAYRGHNIFVKKSRNDLLMSQNCSAAELRARELLAEMIGWDAYVQYLKRGFIVCKGRTGLLYVIYGGHRMIDCYHQVDGKYKIQERICIKFKDLYDSPTCGPLPFTDGVIMRKLLVEYDEFGLRKLANVFPVPTIIQPMTA